MMLLERLNIVNGNKVTDTINYKLAPDGFVARLKQASFTSKMRLLIS